MIEPEGGQDTQVQKLNESEKEAIIEQFREWRVHEAAVVHFAENDDDDVEQKMKRHTSPHAHFSVHACPIALVTVVATLAQGPSGSRSQDDVCMCLIKIILIRTPCH